MLASTHAHTTAADASINYRRYVPQRDFKFPRCPDGIIAYVLASCLDSLLAIVINLLFHQGNVRAAETCNFPIAPMGNSPFARCLQGGGVAVYGGSVSIVNSQIYSNSANGVRARVRNSHHPDGNIADALASLSIAQLWLTLWSTTASKFCRGPQIFPSP